MTNTSGNFREIGKEMHDALEDITSRGNDAEIRKRRDGTFDVFELERKKRKPRQTQTVTE
jgi:hypothetical protein